PGSLARPNHAVLRILESEAAGSLESLAQGYQKLFCRAAERFAADQIVGQPDATDYANLADWLVQHSSCLATDEKRESGAEAAFLAEQNRLAAQIKQTSRLAMAMMDATGVDEHV